MRKITFFITIAFLFAFSCNEEDKPKAFEVVLIGKGNLYGNGEENIQKQSIVITSQDDWTELIEAMKTVNDVSSNFTGTNIDFNRFQVIAVFEEIRYRDGHSIDITEVVETESSIEVKVENLNKGNSTPTVIQPFHIVKVTKSNKQVVFTSSGDFVTIGKGNLSGTGIENIPKHSIVITNQADWLDLIDAMNTQNNVSDKFTETDIDFNQYQIIAAFDELKLYTGSTIDITEVTEVQSSIHVKVENIHSVGFLAALSQPFHIVKIPKSDIPIVFI